MKRTSLLLIAFATACAADSTSAVCCTDGPVSLRIVNAYTTSVDVLIDGSVAIPALAAGAVATTAPSPGSHALVLRPVGSGDPASRSISVASGALGTVAALRAPGGALTTAALDDTGSVVPAGATKVRVLHFAPNAGTLQVYRTQPDYVQPVAWQTPFDYQPAPTTLSAPFYQSTVGTWEVRIWQTPANASGWASAPVKVVVPLGSGEKRTIVILDQAGGGVRVEQF